MKRIKITFSYDGSKFFGSQIQKNKQMPTVIGVMQKAFLKLGIDQSLQASGRTDRGVHALNQVCHVDIPTYFSNLEKLRININKMIHPAVFIKKIEFIDKDFHARFSAKMRLYRYLISHDKFNPFMADYCIFKPDLDTRSLYDNSQLFVGTHDFGYFRKEGSETKTDIRTIYKTGAYRYKNNTIIYFLGNSFLRSQIRMMCDFLLKIENHSLTKDDLSMQLEKKTLISKSPLEPQGLYLSKIFY
ncbi:MAG: tRNA pseudouridine(38-40) synthase TruA [Sulfurospirillaceae bacterium]|nr:tRNA pseudouridine(38-40) synthase TruA [Sulfurospirillaceae bacterium]